MDLTLLDAMEIIRQEIEEGLGAAQPVQEVGTRRSLLGENAEPTSEDTLFIILEVLDAATARQPRRVLSLEERRRRASVDSVDDRDA